MIKLGVIFGGISVEHEVSIISACEAMEVLDKTKYEIIPIYIDKEGTWYTGGLLTDIENYKDMVNLKRYATKVYLGKYKNNIVLYKNRFFRGIVTELDFALPIVHGAGVEDGSLQGYLDMIGLGYVGSKITGASIGQDKVIMKQVLMANDIMVTPYVSFKDFEYHNNPDEIIKKCEELTYPMIVKPATLGSSIGIKIANNSEELKKAIVGAILYDVKIIVEKLIASLEEFNCSVVGNMEVAYPSAIDQIVNNDEFLTFEAKYIHGGKKGKNKFSKTNSMVAINRLLPADITDKLKTEIETMAIDTYKALDASGNVRIDFLYDKKKKELYVNEINTIPGSLAFYLWEAKGKKYEELLDEMITLAIKEYKNKSRKITSFDSNILASYGGMKGSKGTKYSKRR